EIHLRHVRETNKNICTEQQLKRFVERDDVQLRENAGPWTILDQLVTTELKEQGKVLYYQCHDTSVSENCSKHYYQLTVSDETWLQQDQDCGFFCFEIDRKYDLNNEKAPVLSIVIEDEARYRFPSGFGLSDKENHHTI
ncbi:33570_t:CDS:1, partial [Racocetra persica]